MPPRRGFPTSLKVCGDNFAVDVLGTVTAINDDQDWDSVLDCAAEGGGRADDTDVLILRHTAPGQVAPDSSKLQVYSERVAAHMNTRLFVSNDPPGTVEDDLREVRDMVVQTYYISNDSDGRPGMPSLRMKMLSSVGGAPGFIDQEILRGVEDLQVQFGVDPGDIRAGDVEPYDPDDDGMADLVNGFAAQYVNAGDALLNSGQVVSVRIWVRVRGDQPETGFVDNRSYQYADTDFQSRRRFSPRRDVADDLPAQLAATVGRAHETHSIQTTRRCPGHRADPAGGHYAARGSRHEHREHRARVRHQ